MSGTNVRAYDPRDEDEYTTVSCKKNIPQGQQRHYSSIKKKHHYEDDSYHPFSVSDSSSNSSDGDDHDSDNEQHQQHRRRNKHRVFNKFASTEKMFAEMSDSSDEEDSDEEEVQREEDEEDYQQDIYDAAAEDVSALPTYSSCSSIASEDSSSEEEEDSDNDSYASGPETNSDHHEEEDREALPVSPVSSLSKQVFTSPMAHITSTNPSQLVQCTLIRTRSKFNKLSPTTYKLYYTRGKSSSAQLILQAQKQLGNKTSNYHVFDMASGTLTSSLTKKSGNYVGKLRSHDISGKINSMIGKERTKTEKGIILFYNPANSSLPRKLISVLPPLNFATGESVGCSAVGKSTLKERYDSGNTKDLLVLESKDPVYEGGCYRLNFSGRVSTPSVKNFQMVEKGSNGETMYVQFGKVSEDRFNLDFRSPVTPYQAFLMAISQFNL